MLRRLQTFGSVSAKANPASFVGALRLNYKDGMWRVRRRKDVEREAERVGFKCNGCWNCAAVMGRMAQSAAASVGDAEGTGEPRRFGAGEGRSGCCGRLAIS